MKQIWLLVSVFCLAGCLDVVDRSGADSARTVLGEWPQAASGVTSGILVDEYGSPLSGVRVLAADGLRTYQMETTTDALGRFEFSGTTESTILIEPCPLGDRFSPRMMEVPAGDGGLIFRRTELAEPAFVNVRLFDSNSDAEILGARMILFEPLGGFSVYGLNLTAGPMDLGLRVRHGLRFIIRVDGYQSFEGAFDDISGADGDSGEVRLRLSRGFRETFKIVNAHSAAPLVGVSILADGAVVGRSDDFGVAHVELRVAPAAVSFERCDLESVSSPVSLLNRQVNRNVDWRVSPAVTLIRL